MRQRAVHVAALSAAIHRDCIQLVLSLRLGGGIDWEVLLSLQ